MTKWKKPLTENRKRAYSLKGEWAVVGRKANILPYRGYAGDGVDLGTSDSTGA